MSGGAGAGTFTRSGLPHSRSRTGTGAIALALASERPDCDVTAVDVMPDAVALALRNVERLGLSNVTVLQSSWFAALENRSFAMIVSNPPYIDEHDPHLAQGDVRFEPLTALVAANAGLADLDHIVTTSRAFASRRLAARGAWLDAGRIRAGTVYPQATPLSKPAATTAATNA